VRPPFHGLLGRIAHEIGPHSEADPAALLVQLLAVFGNVVGRGPHFTVEADHHYTNMFVVLVGETSKGRALTGRAEAQVMRLAHLYALLDLSDKIKKPHLQAAPELWDYSLRSVQHVFGSSLGDPVADTILDCLRRAHPDLVTRTEIRSSVGGRVQADQIERALGLIQRYASATCASSRPTDDPQSCGATAERVSVEVVEQTEQRTRHDRASSRFSALAHTCARGSRRRCCRH
jgi:hypothetical protein